jgi:hypothetical protein
MLRAHSHAQYSSVGNVTEFRTMCIILAHEPRTYRTVLASAIRELRPHVEVLTVEPDDLDTEVARLHPALVVCSHLTPAVEAYPLSWVLLYPGYQTQAEVSLAGQRTTTSDIDFDMLLSLIDRAHRLVHGEEADHSATLQMH